MRAASLGARTENAPSVRAIASWETDASDVDVFALDQKEQPGDVLGVVDIVKHDGRGDVTVEPRPFVLMTPNATLPVGPID